MTAAPRKGVKPQVRVIVDDGSNDARITRIRLLLETAEGHSRQADAAHVTKHEAEAMRKEADMKTARAYELMTEHRITLAQVEAQGEARREKIEYKEFLVGKPFTGKTALLNGIAQNLNCVVIRMGKVGSTKEKVWAYGFSSDLIALQMLFASLDIQGMRYCRIDEKRLGVGANKASEGGIHPPTYRRAWWQAYAVEIWRRLDAQRKVAESAADTNTPGTSLVLSDKREQVKKVLHEKHSVTKGRRVSRRRFDGMREGREAGQRADLSTGGVTAGAKAVTR